MIASIPPNQKVTQTTLLELPMLTPELLAPAGNMEKLKIAIHYGADAVYLGGESFGLRNLTSLLKI